MHFIGFWQHVKNKKVQHEMKTSGMTVVLYTLWHLLWSITVHTYGKILSICFIYTIKIQIVYWRIWGMKKGKQTVKNQWNAHRSHVIVYIYIYIFITSIFGISICVLLPVSLVDHRKREQDHTQVFTDLTHTESVLWPVA